MSLCYTKDPDSAMGISGAQKTICASCCKIFGNISVRRNDAFPDRAGFLGRIAWHKQARTEPGRCWLVCPGGHLKAAPTNASREREQRLMNWQDSTNGLKPTHGTI